MKELVSTNPSTGEELGRVPVASPRDVQNAVERLRRGFSDWSAQPLTERIKVVRRMAGLLRARAKRIGELMTREQGKPIRESVGEVADAADRLDYFCRTAPQAPWGGVKQSGSGRMLGPEAAREFTNTVNLRLSRGK